MPVEVVFLLIVISAVVIRGVCVSVVY